MPKKTLDRSPDSSDANRAVNTHEVRRPLGDLSVNLLVVRFRLSISGVSLVLRAASSLSTAVVSDGKAVGATARVYRSDALIGEHFGSYTRNRRFGRTNRRFGRTLTMKLKKNRNV